ncbi:hypothetical protein TNCT_91801 [Trichonephila clavata]|uniref:Uncharacterized protein n=1 Tax=Trichonephila clavata TaxID=2740835 RepID=A0A8X6HUS9_TRICU|nr:hypothetical protein TNCT_91801 [Trichonephila clavata]
MYYGRNCLKQFIRSNTDLLKCLGGQGIPSTENIRENLINTMSPLEESKFMRMKEKRPSDLAFCKYSEIFAGERNGCETVTVATDFNIFEPLFDVKGQIKGHGENIIVRCLV